MGDGGTLINFGEISKPATVLIEKICNAVGIVYEPARIKRRARAEAEAQKIMALNQIELSDIERRGIERFIHQEARKQENIESITALAVPFLSQNANADNLDEDWIAYFFKHCDTVSDKEMQSLWARLLSQEAEKPGAFSKRTIDFISKIDKKDAELFTNFCQFVWEFDGGSFPLVYNFEDEIFKEKGVVFSVLKHLEAIGLISFDWVNGYACPVPTKQTQVSYGQPVTIECPKETDNKLEIGQVVLTGIGLELLPICGAVKNDEFYQYVLRRWIQKGLVLSSPLTHGKAAKK